MRNVQFPTTKAKTSLEADVLDKDSVEAVQDKDGKYFFVFPFAFQPHNFEDGIVMSICI